MYFTRISTYALALLFTTGFLITSMPSTAHAAHGPPQMVKALKNDTCDFRKKGNW